MVNLFFVTDISGFENDYGVTEEGEIYSFRRNKFLIACPTNVGYLSVILCKSDRVSGKGKCLSVHRIVALTFIPNPNNYPCVDHIDRNKRNNCVSNLRWVTYSQNNSNKTAASKSYSQYKGVYWHTGKWVAAIDVNKKKIHLGRFQNEIEAAVAYNNGVDRYFGDCEFHYKNII